ncbi:regulatory protein RecX [Persephonella sp.]
MRKEALSYAFKLLSKRDYFSSELKDKLIKKGFDSEEANSIVQYLEDKGYINDLELRERLSNVLKEKGKSPLYIKKKFYSKGIEPPEISYQDEYDIAYDLLKRKYKKEKQFHTVVKFLKNRGFSYSVIIDVANKFLEEEE